MNDRTKKRFFLLIAGSVGTLLASTSFAADASTPATATATIDWSKLQISVTGVDGTTPTVNFSGQNSSLNSYAQSPGQYESNSKSLDNWTETAQVTSDAGTAFANGLASQTDFSGTANSTLGGYSNFSGSRTESFSFSGPGILTITVPYTISLTDTTSTCYYCYNDDHASVSGHASFYSYANNGSSSSNSDVSYSLSNNYFDTSPPSQSGTLVFGIFANGPGNGSLSLNFDAGINSFVSSIPEPESYAMLLAGLGLMGAVVRRRVKAERSLK
jgi:hypothetical protein